MKWSPFIKLIRSGVCSTRSGKLYRSLQPIKILIDSAVWLMLQQVFWWQGKYQSSRWFQSAWLPVCFSLGRNTPEKKVLFWKWVFPHFSFTDTFWQEVGCSSVATKMRLCPKRPQPTAGETDETNFFVL